MFSKIKSFGSQPQLGTANQKRFRVPIPLEAVKQKNTLTPEYSIFCLYLLYQGSTGSSNSFIIMKKYCKESREYGYGYHRYHR